MRKYLVACLVMALLLLVIAEATAFNVGRYPKDTEGFLVAYVNEEVEVEDPDKIRMCFLSDAQNYQGVSVEELFDEALPPMTGKVVLLAAMLDIRTFQWMFLYADVW